MIWKRKYSIETSKIQGMLLFARLYFTEKLPCNANAILARFYISMILDRSVILARFEQGIGIFSKLNYFAPFYLLHFKRQEGQGWQMTYQ